MDAAFFTVSDANYFPGVVALDCGVTARHRELLASHSTLSTCPAILLQKYLG